MDGGAKEGDSKDAPKPRTFTEGWNIPKPDLVLDMNTFHIPATGDIQYQYVVLPTKFTEDQWIQAAEARPSDRTVVHHVVIFVRDPQIEVAARSQAWCSLHSSWQRKGLQQYIRRRQRYSHDLHAWKDPRDVAARVR